MRKYRLELVCESEADEPEETILRTSTDAARLLAPLFAGADREKFMVLLLDAKHRPIGVNIVSVGSLTASIVHPRLCFAKHNLGYVAAIIMLSSARSSSAMLGGLLPYATYSRSVSAASPTRNQSGPLDAMLRDRSRASSVSRGFVLDDGRYGSE